MSSNKTLVKQVVAIRRKPDMTRKEFLDHHYQVHGSISDGPEDSDIKPHKYIQVHIFDGAFGGRPNELNANHFWVGRDDVTELYFRDWAHLQSVFTSDYVKTDVAPDGPKFSDIESPMPLMAQEKTLTFQSAATGQQPQEGARTVAMLWLSAANGTGNGAELEGLLSSKLTSALETHAAGEVWGLLANIGIQPDGFDVTSYFGGSKTPNYAVVYKIFLKDRASATAVRKAQAAFYGATKEHLNLHESFIVFGVEGLIMDIGNNIRFDPKRQPHFPDLPGKSHLDG